MGNMKLSSFLILFMIKTVIKIGYSDMIGRHIINMSVIPEEQSESQLKNNLQVSSQIQGESNQVCLLLASLIASAEQCGKQANGAVCPDGLCCSQYGWCGNTDSYCGPGCQSQCKSGGGGGDIGRLLGSSFFNQMLKYRNIANCPAHGFYTYDAFIAAALSFNGFGTTGNDTIRKRELAAFLAQTSHETTGGWPTAPDGPYAWGYCYVNESSKEETFCAPTTRWPCAPGKQYYGRGPFQLAYNYNYGQAGEAIGVDLINYPDLVSTDPTVSFKTAIWFWMTPQTNLSSHDVIIGKWTPSDADRSAGRVRGYGLITNLINGGLECGHGKDDRGDNRVGFYRRYCEILGVSPGDNLDCNNQGPFG